MSEHIALRSSADWVELRTSGDDWSSADPALLGTLLSHMHLIRGFEEAVWCMAPRIPALARRGALLARSWR
jgi:TPP-dependent pyruvate/acetoin dehydrogenase alpha subunit